MKLFESIREFFESQRNSHNGPDLLDRWTPNMETQVNVHKVPKCNCRPVRIPWKAKSAPEFVDREMSWVLSEHVSDIGCTGWDGKSRLSRWVGFDFDAITGHAAGVGITSEKLEEVKRAASALPWVEVRKSTSGAGLHLYVCFDDQGVKTDNHTEHAALARTVLAKISTDAGFDFASHIDACGSILWIWSHRANPENEGFRLIKAAEQVLTTADIPTNWLDHVDVVTRKRSKVRVRGVDNEAALESLAAARTAVSLDDKHKAVIDALVKRGFWTLWVPDHHLLQTHTTGFAELIADLDFSRELDLKGYFQTNSPGSDRGQPNCFAFPLRDGAWKVFRFSQGHQEAHTWDQDGFGWTSCYFNQKPSLEVAAKALGGVERPENRGFTFDSARTAVKVAQALGQAISLEPKLLERHAILKPNKDGRLVMEIDRLDGDPVLPGWDCKGKKGKSVAVFNVRTEKQASDEISYDNVVRAIVTPAGEDAGYMVRSAVGTWDAQSANNAKKVLQSLGCSSSTADCALGEAVVNRWCRVALPFSPEYPGGRQWNLDAPQFRVQPAIVEDDQVPQHPTWDLVLNHIGADLDVGVASNEWCQQNGVQSGAEWLKLWIAAALQFPRDPTPYLFLFGPEDCGKSILHEALRLLITKGVVSADRALTNSNNFNGELAGGVFAIVEETDIAKASHARDRMKEWVTSQSLAIRKMRTDTFHQPNTLHFIQCANSRNNCPVFPGDTRIVMCFVPKPTNPIPKVQLLKRLEDESAQFLATVVQTTLPPPAGRLRVAVIETINKVAAGKANAPIAQFIEDCCCFNPKGLIAKSDLYTNYKDWCAENGLDAVDRNDFGRELLCLTQGKVDGSGKVVTRSKKRVDAYRGIELAIAA